jgi:hypothetical protein
MEQRAAIEFRVRSEATATATATTEAFAMVNSAHGEEDGSLEFVWWAPVSSAWRYVGSSVTPSSLLPPFSAG